jgi:hypothetical protein
MRRRGGARRRYVSREETPVTCSGRWGPKRVRVTQCLAVLTAENAYTGLMRDDFAKMRPGVRGSLDWVLGACGFSINWELRPNSVWRFGRLFLRCPKCDRLATRIYVPTAESWAACRRCWGLTYESRQHRNYKSDSFARKVGLDSLARWYTAGARERRAEASEVRYAERRQILRRERSTLSTS